MNCYYYMFGQNNMQQPQHGFNMGAQINTQTGQGFGSTGFQGGFTNHQAPAVTGGFQSSGFNQTQNQQPWQQTKGGWGNQKSSFPQNTANYNNSGFLSHQKQFKPKIQPQINFQQTQGGFMQGGGFSSFIGAGAQTATTGFMTKQPSLGFNMHSQHTGGKNHSAPKNVQGGLIMHKSQSGKNPKQSKSQINKGYKPNGFQNQQNPLWQSTQQQGPPPLQTQFSQGNGGGFLSGNTSFQPKLPQTSGFQQTTGGFLSNKNNNSSFKKQEVNDIQKSPSQGMGGFISQQSPSQPPPQSWSIWGKTQQQTPPIPFLATPSTPAPPPQPAALQISNLNSNFIKKSTSPVFKPQSPKIIKNFKQNQIPPEQKQQVRNQNQVQKQPPQKQEEKDEYDDEYDDQYDEEYGEEEQKEIFEGEEGVSNSQQKPCMHHLLGKCKNADKCSDLHFEVPNVPPTICKHFLMDSCNYGEGCKKKHDDSFKTKWLPKLAEALMLALEQQQIKSKYKKQKETEKKKVASKVQKFEDVPPPPKFIGQPRAMPIVQKPAKIEIPQFEDAPTAQKDIQYVNKIDKMLQRLQACMDNLAKAGASAMIENKALCLRMCDPAQLEDVSRQFSHFEKDQNMGQYELLAVKRFTRSDAGKNMDDANNLRPPLILNLTMKYLTDCIIDQDLVPPGQSFYLYANQQFGEIEDIETQTHNFEEIYSFMKDRTRQISQDMSIINARPDIYSIECLEMVVRYLIISQHDGMSVENFEIYSNMKQITGVLGDLLDKQYPQVVQKDQEVLHKNKVEMFCYQIIASAHSEVEFTRLMAQMGNLSDYTPEQALLLKQAIKISTSVQLQDFQMFFNLFKKTNFMFACLMLNFFEHMRRFALQTLLKSHNRGLIRGEFIANQLLLPDKGDLFNCIKAYGFVPDKLTCNFIIDHSQRADSEIWNVTIKKFRQKHLPLLDSKRALSENRLRRDFVLQGISITLVKSQEQIDLEKAEAERRAQQIKIKAEQQEQKKKEKLEKAAAEDAKNEMEKIKAQVLIDSFKVVQSRFKKLRKALKLNQFKQLTQAAKQVRPLIIKSLQDKEELKRLEHLKELQRKKEQEMAELALKQQKLKQMRLEKQKQIFGHALRQINRKQIIQQELTKAKQRAFDKWRQQCAKMKKQSEVLEQLKVQEQFQAYLNQTNFQVNEQRLNSDLFECNVNNLSPQDKDLAALSEAFRDKKGKFVVQVINFAENELIADCVVEFLNFKHEQYELRVSTSIKELSKGEFSTCVIITGQNFDLSKFCTFLNKRSSRMPMAGIRLHVISIDSSESYLSQLLQESIESGFISTVTETPLKFNKTIFDCLPKQKERIKFLSQSLLKVKLQTLNFVTHLVRDPVMIETDLEKSKYDLVSLVSYAIQNLSIELEGKTNLKQNTIEVFNHWLAQFKLCISQLKNLFANQCQLEFTNEIRDSHSLPSASVFNFVSSLLKIEPIPLPSLKIKDKHLLHLIETLFAPKLPFPFSSGVPTYFLSSGTQLFKHFLSCLWHAINSKVFEVEIYISKVKPLEAVIVSKDVKDSQPNKTIDAYLKQQFPRDFDSSHLQKRTTFKSPTKINIANLCEPQHVSKREAKLIRKLNQISYSRVPQIAQYLDLRDNLSFETGSEDSPMVIDDECRMSLNSDQLITPKAASISYSLNDQEEEASSTLDPSVLCQRISEKLKMKHYGDFNSPIPLDSEIEDLKVTNFNEDALGLQEALRMQKLIASVMNDLD